MEKINGEKRKNKEEDDFFGGWCSLRHSFSAMIISLDIFLQIWGFDWWDVISEIFFYFTFYLFRFFQLTPLHFRCDWLWFFIFYFGMFSLFLVHCRSRDFDWKGLNLVDLVAVFIHIEKLVLNHSREVLYLLIGVFLKLNLLC